MNHRPKILLPKTDTHELVWSEDDAAPFHSDHERLHAAFKRLGLGNWSEERVAAKNAGRFKDGGDAFFYALEDGTVVVSSYPGASEIWKPK